MTMIQTIKNTGRGALIALALGATAFTVVPAQAASPQGSFSIQLGNQYGNGGYGNGMQFGNGNIQLHFGNDFYDRCLTNSQIVRGLDKRGFDHVKIVKKLNDRKVVAIGKYGRSWYEMRVDRCTGKVDKVKRVKQRTNGSFSITLNF